MVALRFAWRVVCIAWMCLRFVLAVVAALTYVALSLSVLIGLITYTSP